MILTFQTCFPTVDEEQRFADINVPPTRRVDDLFKVVCAETGVSLTSPMEMEINGEKYYRNDMRTLEEANINEYDMVEVKVLKNGGRPIPGNVTVMDMYEALGDRLKRMKMDSPLLEVAVRENVKEEKAAPIAVSAAPVVVKSTPAPVAAPAPVTAPAPVNAFAVKAPAPVNAFAVKKPVVNAFAVKKPTVNAFAVKAPTSTPAATEEKPAPAPEPAPAPATAPAPNPTSAFSVKPANPFAVKPLGGSKFMVKKP